MNKSTTEFLATHTPVLFQVSDGSVTDVAPVHRVREANCRHTLIGRLQGQLQRRLHCSDRQDPPAAGDHASFFQGCTGMENLQPHVLNQGQP